MQTAVQDTCRLDCAQARAPDADEPNVKRLNTAVVHLLPAIALGVGFLLMSSVFVPDFSQAGPDNRGTAPSAAPIMIPVLPESVDVHEGLVSLGTIENATYLVDIYSGADEPRYSIYDRLDGSSLGVLLSASDAAAAFPDLPLTSMDFGTEEVLMMMAVPDYPDF